MRVEEKDDYFIVCQSCLYQSVTMRRSSKRMPFLGLGGCKPDEMTSQEDRETVILRYRFPVRLS